MREEDFASKFQSSIEREVVKFLGATALIKPLLDKIEVAEIVNSYTSDKSEISHGSRSRDIP
ncbi:MAG: hypothetical protein ACE5KT_00500 [Methanosarcinales archaeon]